ncbi:MAG: UvrB/UvrC motif-containing protein [Planctomycetaceae bacterium]
MKKCRRCSKPSTLHITEIHDGHAVAIHLCEGCAREYLEDDSEDGVHDPAADLAAKLEALVTGDDEESQTRCPNCDLSFAEFREKGRLGCANCYEEFRDELMPLLENIHEESDHRGKRPNRTPGQTEDQYRLIQLRNQQRAAIEKEEYEAAATLRDEISALEASLLQKASRKS